MRERERERERREKEGGGGSKMLCAYRVDVDWI